MTVGKRSCKETKCKDCPLRTLCQINCSIAEHYPALIISKTSELTLDDIFRSKFLDAISNGWYQKSIFEIYKNSLEQKED